MVASMVALQPHVDHAPHDHVAEEHPAGQAHQPVLDHRQVDDVAVVVRRADRDEDDGEDIEEEELQDEESSDSDIEYEEDDAGDVDEDEIDF